MNDPDPITGVRVNTWSSAPSVRRMVIDAFQNKSLWNLCKNAARDKGVANLPDDNSGFCTLKCVFELGCCQTKTFATHFVGQDFVGHDARCRGISRATLVLH